MKQLLGGLLLGVGILIAGVSGLCSAAWLVLGFVSLFVAPNVDQAVTTAFFGFMVVMIVGGIPFGIGTGLIFAGRHFLRDAKAADASEFE